MTTLDDDDDDDELPRGDGNKEWGAKKRLYPPAARYRWQRASFDERDLTEVDQLEDWIAEQLHDWRAETEAELLETMIGALEAARAEVIDLQNGDSRDDLQRSGYLDGQLYMINTVLAMCGRAAEVRRRRVGGTPS